MPGRSPCRAYVAEGGSVPATAAAKSTHAPCGMLVPLKEARP
jgi:hypothetical protein